MQSITRAEWRDAIKAFDAPLGSGATAVALIMADYWPKGADGDLWCTLATLVGHTKLSQSSVTRGLKELQTKGFLVQTQRRSQYRSPRYRPTIPEQSSQSDQSGLVTETDPECSQGALTLDVTPNLKLDSELNRVTAGASTSQEINLPSQREPEPPAVFVDWRPGDQELFAEMIGYTHIRSDGSGPWNEGEWPVGQWYGAFHRRKKKPLDWPGQYFERLEGDRAVEDYLSAFGLEPVDVDVTTPVHDPWATSKSA